MADFCKQCCETEPLHHSPYTDDLKGLTTLEDTLAGKYANGLCEGCGPNLVDHTGKCVSSDCHYKHGSVAWDDSLVAFW